MRRAQVVVYVHLVWATWDRLPLLSGEVKRVAYRAIGAACEEMEAEVVALGVVEDHVHLLVRLPATVNIAALVKQVVTVSVETARLVGGLAREVDLLAAVGVASD